MKVCTDSCLFGAVVEVGHAKRILDIGTGTGLLSLMVAQRSYATIDAVEINSDAASQAEENFATSPWKERLNLHPVSLQQFANYGQQNYDVILSNPPFFLASLKSGNAAKDSAKHTGDLFFEDILAFAQKHLTPDGKLYILLPPTEAIHFASLAPAHQLFLTETIEVFTYIKGQCIRHIQTYSFAKPDTTTICQLHIREADKVTYTTAFTELLKGYYLHL